MEAYIEATGGREAYAKVKTVLMEKTIEVPVMGLEMNGTIWQALPNKMVQQFDNSMMGKVTSGTDGEHYWQVTETDGAALLHGRQRGSIISQLAMNAPMNWKRFYKSATCVGIEEVDGQPCYKVEMTSHVNETETRYYSTSSKLLVKSVLVQPGYGSNLTLKTKFEDYQMTAGISSPRTVRQMRLRQETIHRIKRIAYNEEFPPDRLQTPQEVKVLLASGVSQERP